MKLRASPADGGLIIKDRYYHLRKYHSSFVGELIISKLNESETQCHTMYNLCVCWRPVLWVGYLCGVVGQNMYLLTQYLSGYLHIVGTN